MRILLKSLRNFFITIFVYIGRGCLSLYLKTLYITIKNNYTLHTEEENQKKGVIYVIWHDSLLALPLLETIFSHNGTKNVHILISKSKDGDAASQLVSTYANFYPLRVAHNAKSQALRSAISHLKEGCCIIITPDGPKGPRRSIKGGALYAAHICQSPVVAISVTWKSAKQLASWDKFFLPFPFSCGEICIHSPLFFSSMNVHKLQAQSEAEKENYLLLQSLLGK